MLYTPQEKAVSYSKGTYNPIEKHQKYAGEYVAFNPEMKNLLLVCQWDGNVSACLVKRGL